MGGVMSTNTVRRSTESSDLGECVCLVLGCRSRCAQDVQRHGSYDDERGKITGGAAPRGGGSLTVHHDLLDDDARIDHLRWEGGARGRSGDELLSKTREGMVMVERGVASYEDRYERRLVPYDRIKLVLDVSELDGQCTTAFADHGFLQQGYFREPCIFLNFVVIVFFDSRP